MRPIIALIMAFGLMANYCPNNNPSTPAVSPTYLSKIKSLAMGFKGGVCALDDQGRAGCWSHPQVFVPNSPGAKIGHYRLDYPKKSLADLAGEKYTAVILGEDYGDHLVCAVRDDGKVRCAIIAGFIPTKVDQLASLGTFKQVSVGEKAFCGIRDTGALACYLMEITHSESEYSAAGLSNFSLGSNYYGCGITSAKKLDCVFLLGTDMEIVPGQKAKKIGTPSGMSGGPNYAILQDDKMIPFRGDNKSFPAFTGDLLKEHFKDLSARSVGEVCGIIESSSQILCFKGPKDSFFPKKTNADLEHERFLEITAGFGVDCGLRTDKTAMCWSAKDYPIGVPAGIRAD